MEKGLFQYHFCLVWCVCCVKKLRRRTAIWEGYVGFARYTYFQGWRFFVNPTRWGDKLLWMGSLGVYGWVFKILHWGYMNADWVHAEWREVSRRMEKGISRRIRRMKGFFWNTNVHECTRIDSEIFDHGLNGWNEWLWSHAECAEWKGIFEAGFWGTLMEGKCCAQAAMKSTSNPT